MYHILVAILIIYAIYVSLAIWWLKRYIAHQEAEWRAEHPELGEVSDFYTGDFWSAAQLAKMNADMRNMAPLRFSRTGIVLPPDSESGEVNSA